MGKMISIIGAGGKTTSMLAISKYLSDKRVLMTTTTHILPVEPPQSRELLKKPQREDLMRALCAPGIVCAGIPVPSGKLCGLPSVMLEEAGAMADYTVCEADSAHGMPLKLHQNGEPVIPKTTDICLIVAGLSALGRSVCRSIHQFELNPWWKEQSLKEVTEEDFLICIREAAAVSRMPREKICILLNQTDALPKFNNARKLAQQLQEEGFRCREGSMAQAPEELIPWILDT